MLSWFGAVVAFVVAFVVAPCVAVDFLRGVDIGSGSSVLQSPIVFPRRRQCCSALTAMLTGPRSRLGQTLDRRSHTRPPFRRWGNPAYSPRGVSHVCGDNVHNTRFNTRFPTPRCAARPARLEPFPRPTRVLVPRIGATLEAYDTSVSSALGV